jgi:hypothetical protein
MEWYDYLIRAGAIAGAIAAIGYVVGWSFRYFIVRPIERLIDERTELIQPTANAGNSLPDALRILYRLEEKQSIIRYDIVKLKEDLVEHLRDHKFYEE